jgi:hypothetical protein
MHGKREFTKKVEINVLSTNECMPTNKAGAACTKYNKTKNMKKKITTNR